MGEVNSSLRILLQALLKGARKCLGDFRLPFTTVLVYSHLALWLLAVMVKQNLMQMSAWWSNLAQPLYTGSRENKGARCKEHTPS